MMGCAVPGLSPFGKQWEPWLWNILLLPGLSCGNVLKPRICVIRDPQTDGLVSPSQVRFGLEGPRSLVYGSKPSLPGFLPTSWHR